jgi:hypothetical protein
MVKGCRNPGFPGQYEGIIFNLRIRRAQTRSRPLGKARDSLDKTGTSGQAKDISFDQIRIFSSPLYKYTESEQPRKDIIPWAGLEKPL